MTYKHFFQWNIPADNQFSGQTDRYIDVVVTWYGGYYTDGRPMVYADGINFSFSDAFQVKDWYTAKRQIEQLAEAHFNEIAKAERIAQARATLVSEGEPTGIPTLDRYTEKMHDLIIQETLS
jgi:hypothetical protein